MRRLTPKGRRLASTIQPATWARSCDAEARLAREPHRVSVEAAAAGDRRPGRGRPALQGPPRLPVQVHVLEQQQRPAGDEDPAELGERRRRVRHRAERERAHGGVEARVRERQSSARPSTTVTRAAARAARRRARSRMEASGSSAVTGLRRVPAELRARAGADLEHAPARAAARRRRQSPTAARSNGHMTASYTAALPPAGVEMRASILNTYAPVRPRPPVHAPPAGAARMGRWWAWPAFRLHEVRQGRTRRRGRAHRPRSSCVASPTSSCCRASRSRCSCCAPSPRRSP